MGVENTIYALEDDRPTVERLIRTMDETDEPMLEVVASCPVEIINL
jgi:hypothetical protein